MSFETDEAHNDLLQKLDCAQPGDTIDLEQPPMSINVEIFPDLDEDDEKTKNMKVEVRNQWKFGSLTDYGRIIIPIKQATGKAV